MDSKMQVKILLFLAMKNYRDKYYPFNNEELLEKNY
jgi:hypothetical protein